MDITEEMGAIHISPKSHLEGNLNLLQKRKKDLLHSTQTPVPNELVKKYDDEIELVLWAALAYVALDNADSIGKIFKNNSHLLD
jgi:hypothetical protein